MTSTSRPDTFSSRATPSAPLPPGAGRAPDARGLRRGGSGAVGQGDSRPVRVRAQGGERRSPLPVGDLAGPASPGNLRVVADTAAGPERLQRVVMRVRPPAP